MIAALAFLTPLGRSAPPGPAATWWFGPVGALIGGLSGLAWWGAAEVWSAPVAALGLVIADLVLTGMLHVDGLADSGDGLLAPMERERRLVVMAAPEIGAFGTTVVVTVLLARWAAAASIEPDAGDVALVAALWAATRSAMAFTLATVPYARPGGLAEAFRGAHRVGPALVGLALVGPLAVVGAGGTGALAVGVALLVFAVVLVRAMRLLGGFTGDVLGAAGVVAETTGLLVLAA